MFTWRFTAIAILVVVTFLPVTGSMAQKQDTKTAMVDQLFDNFLRRGDLPMEFKISIYRTAKTGVGAYMGTISARNTFIKIGDRTEPALIVRANLSNLAPGPHAFHIHENPDCGAKQKDGVMVPGLAAGGHLFSEYTTAAARPVSLICGSNLGSLPNLLVKADGTVKAEIAVPRLSLADLVNRSIIVHASQDDSSAREVCGVFK